MANSKSTTCKRPDCTSPAITKSGYCGAKCANKRPIKPLAQRFWLKVRITDTCWLWLGAHGLQGHGQIMVNRETRITAAHRVSWELHYGPVPAGMQVLHKCDNPPCVRPDHLFLGTAKDNAIDCARKGRNAATRKTHCPKGHAYTPENTSTTRGYRRCLQCQRDYMESKRRARGVQPRGIAYRRRRAA